MDKEQRDFLIKRIQDVKAPDDYRRRDKQKDPPDIKRARKMIEVYESHLEREVSRQADRFRKARLKAQEVLHKGDYDKALAAVQGFEAHYSIEE